MNRTAIPNAPFSDSQLHNGETLAVIHESAKQRAHALRREAFSGFFEAIIAWALRKPAASQRVIATQTPCASGVR